ncbi:MAG: hypothetical protein RTU30_00800 [Candidatus Thorarchaeota archaeon]
MCFYANAFLPSITEDTLQLPEELSGLVITIGTRIQEDFKTKFGDQDGVFLVFDDGHCLCQYQDWLEFHLILEKIRLANAINEISVLLYWSDRRYILSEMKIVDFGLDNIEARPEEGVLFSIGISVPRRLQVKVGTKVRLTYKSGKTVEGILDSFSPEERYGIIMDESEQVYFNDNEIENVSLDD